MDYMDEQKIGFIGLGNMGSTLVEGILTKDLFSAHNFYLYDHHDDNPERIKNLFPEVTICDSSQALAHEVDIVILAVKPKDIQLVLLDIQKELKKSTIVVSIAAGVTIKKIQKYIGYDQKVVRTMPNTPSLVNEGMTAISPNTEVSDEELDVVKALFDCVGQTAIIPESLMHAAIGVAGSAPAYVFLFIEALADGAVKAGMSRKQAYQFAAQTVMGSAKLVQETGMHPAELKDRVCSPGGTTIYALQALEDNGFRSAVMDAVDATVSRSIALESES